MLTGGTFSPAYGRDYKSKAEVVAAFEAGKDFMFNSYNGDGYASIADVAPGARVQLRYAGQRKVTVYTKKG